MTFHRISLGFLYVLTVLAVGYLIGVGGEYYSLPKVDRPHHDLHAAYKPSGAVGHGLGIVGSFLMVTLLLYSARKRLKAMREWGNIRYWLNYHIWMGVTGPLLVIFHTSFKLGGIVAVSFWSMIGVALSGVLGRYIYLQIPRSLEGHELSARELAEIDREMLLQLQERYRVDEETLRQIQAASGDDSAGRTGWAGLWNWMLGDVALGGKLAAIRRRLLQAGGSSADAGAAMKLIRRKVKLRRRMAFLSTAHALLHHWHVIHKPFAIVMLVIMVVHVVVTILFGYRWVFGA